MESPLRRVLAPMVPEGEHKTAEPIQLCYRIEQDNESGGWARNAVSTAASQRNDEAAYDRGIQTILWCNPAGDCQCHGQRNGDNPDAYPGQHIPLQARRIVRFIAKACITQGVADAKRK